MALTNGISVDAMTKLRSRKRQDLHDEERQTNEASSSPPPMSSNHQHHYPVHNMHMQHTFCANADAKRQCPRLLQRFCCPPKKSILLRNLFVVICLIVFLFQTVLQDDDVYQSTSGGGGPSCLVEEQPVEWVYNIQQHPSVSSSTTSDYHRQGRHRLLIAQYQYMNPQDTSLLIFNQIVSKINRAYASTWQQDYVLLKSNCPIKDYKQVLLQLAYDKNTNATEQQQNLNHYDQVLTLDGNSILFDFDRDVTTLIPYNKNDDNNLDHNSMVSLVASASSSLLARLLRLWRWESKPTTALWKLKPTTKEAKGTAISTTPRKTLSLSHNEFGGPSGTVVRTLQPQKEDWTAMDDTMGHVCLFEPSICNYNNNNNNNLHRRNPRWDWRYYSKNDGNHGNSNNDNPRKKVLLAQYSAFGSYAKLLELTAPLNKAYAKLYHYDYVALQGSTLTLFPRDAWYPIPEERSRFDKIALLQMAMARNYDHVLLLDADAMVYDFSKNIVAEYLPNDDGDDGNDNKGYLLAAHRVVETDSRHTWNINNGVTIWNLRHPKAVEIIDGWEERTRTFLNKNPTTRFYQLRGDQSFLHGVLKRQSKSDLSEMVLTYLHEFQYRNGTVIKHFIREGLDWKTDNVWQRTSLDTRSENIEKAKRDVCDNYATELKSCQELEMTVYTD